MKKPMSAIFGAFLLVSAVSAFAQTPPAGAQNANQYIQDHYCLVGRDLPKGFNNLPCMAEKCNSSGGAWIPERPYDQRGTCFLCPAGQVLNVATNACQGKGPLAPGGKPSSPGPAKRLN